MYDASQLYHIWVLVSTHMDNLFFQNHAIIYTYGYVVEVAYGCFKKNQ